ncbi:hypothetical protein J7438_09930 [Thalassotalea sp. G20_0]|uniref:hypothetical protein n=1 Tax=Thalassotalea sp. G20_0 TaxID=2821093 RepID=UPI001ADCF204|nr:hypothetical protein [Thalassotalea sp. G20_0]MBO9494401.1 hypothetical protein [Thalassotalea sp. G20_0]
MFIAMDPKNTSFQNTYFTPLAYNHPLSATHEQMEYNQWLVGHTQLQLYHTGYQVAPSSTSTPVLQRQMALRSQTESHFPRNKPTCLHAFLESSANEPPVTWLNKEQGILKINDWYLTEAQWKQDQRLKGVLNPSELHNALCHSEDITALSGQQYRLSSYKADLVTKKTTTKALRHQHAPYNIPERRKGPERSLSTHSSGTGLNITTQTQHEIARSPQLYACTFLARQADIGLSVQWINKDRGTFKVINTEQVKKEWSTLQRQLNVVNGETLQDALIKEIKNNDVECVGLTDSYEIIFQLKFKHYSADTTSSVKNNQSIAQSTSRQATPITTPPQITISTLANTGCSTPGMAQTRSTLPEARTDARKTPLSAQSAKQADPIKPTYKAPTTRSCEGCLSFIFSNADGQQSFATWHDRAAGELIIDMKKLTTKWLSTNPSGYRERTEFDFVARFFAVQNYWTYDETRNIFSLNLRHPMVLNALKVTTQEPLWQSSFVRASDPSDLASHNKPLSASEAGASHQPPVTEKTNLLAAQKNPMLEWIKQDVNEYHNFTEWYDVSRNQLILNPIALQKYWTINLKFFSLENIPSNAAHQSISQLVEEGLCHYDPCTRLLTLI